MFSMCLSINFALNAAENEFFIEIKLISIQIVQKNQTKDAYHLDLNATTMTQ
jgi:hypothetical protein